LSARITPNNDFHDDFYKQQGKDICKFIAIITGFTVVVIGVTLLF